MIEKKVQGALNKHLNAELYSSYLYLSMSAYFESINLKGFANWMRVQAQEELVHALKFYSYICERGGKVILTSIESPETRWNSPLHAFEHVLKHEQKVTGLINSLVNLSVSKSEHATSNFLQWFVAEQVEEEASAEQIVQKLKMLDDDRSGLLFLDQELSKRVFVLPSSSEKSGEAN